jgi:hypothetical protein
VSDQAVVYAASTSQEAHLLKNLLEEAGIQAIVTNDLLQGGSGIDVLGWPTLARVVVSAEDAPAALRIASEFDKRAESPLESPAWEGPSPPGPDAWPTCPECGRRRLTRCPACGTSGTDFLSGDANLSGASGLAATAGQGPCCGPAGCTSTGPVPEGEAQSLVLCPTCDEPFAPQYPRRCEWCGHEFADGYEADSSPPPAETQLNARVLVAIMAITVLAIVLAAYLASLFR